MIVPVGELPYAGFTVAVRVMDWPKAGVYELEDIGMEVEARFTVCVNVADVPGAKFESPV